MLPNGEELPPDTDTAATFDRYLTEADARAERRAAAIARGPIVMTPAALAEFRAAQALFISAASRGSRHARTKSQERAH